MRKLLPLVAALLAWSWGANAQQLPHVPAQSLHTPPAAPTPDQLGSFDHQAASSRTGGQVIWSETFNNGLPNTWTATDIAGVGGWIWSTAGSQGQFAAGTGTVASPTASNGFMLLDADGHNTPGSAGTFQNVEASITSPAIDLSQYPAVTLNFYHYHRPFTNAEYNVEVSNDGINWTTWDVRNDWPTNTASTNPLVETIYISSVAGGQSTVFLRFRWANESHYFWQIDDVSICVAPDNDITLTETYYNNYQDSTNSRHYSAIPQNQASGDTNFFAGVVQNLGGASQPNTKLQVSVSGSATWSRTSAPSTLAVNAIDSINVAEFNQYDYFIPWATGNYNVNFSMNSDSSDITPADNSSLESFSVTTNEYAWDDDNYGGLGFWYGANTDYALGNYYFIANPDSVDAIDVLFQGNTKVGSIIVPNIWDLNDLTAPPLLSTTNFITLTANDIGAWTSFDVPNTALPPGEYAVGYETFGADSVLVGASDDPAFNNNAPPLTVFVNVSGGGWGFTTGFAPYIRLLTTGITDPCNAPINPTVTNITCLGASDGSISLNIPGATSYTWSNGSTGASISGLVAGTYNVTATGGGCTWNGAYTITQPSSLLSAVTASTDDNCAAGNGTATITPNGGNSPYQYVWSNGQTGGTAVNLTSGTYSVTVTDVSGCTTTGSATVTGTPGVTASPDTTFVTCGANDGTIDVNVLSGTAPYNYTWMGPSGIGNTATPTGLPVGNYSVTVTDANNCTSIYPIELSNQNSPEVQNNITSNVQCNGDNNGSITVLVVGGTGTYTYAWTGPSAFTSSNQNISGLAPGPYELELSDALGCVSIFNDTITEPTAILSSSTFTDVTCNGFTDGSAALTVSGGTSPYNATWTGPGNPGSGLNVSGLGAGTYTANITDANGCTATDMVTITEPTAISISNSVVVDFQPIGSVSITVAGGAPPYSYQWVGPGGFGGITEDINNLTVPGTYSVTITDADGCTYSEDFNVFGITVPEVDPTKVSMSVYPNPNTGQFFVKFEDLEQDNYVIQVQNLLGQTIYTETATLQGNLVKVINLEELGKGVYFLNVNGSERKSTERIIVH